jgi:hypothetical protein
MMVGNRTLHIAMTILPVAMLAACRTMGPVEPREYITAKQPSRVWVTEADGSVSVFEGPKLVGDTLAGFVRGEYRELPLSNVKQVVARQPNKKKTILSITAGTLATAGLLFLITGSGPGASDIPEDDEMLPPN